MSVKSLSSLNNTKVDGGGCSPWKYRGKVAFRMPKVQGDDTETRSKATPKTRGTDQYQPTGATLIRTWQQGQPRREVGQLFLPSECIHMLFILNCPKIISNPENGYFHISISLIKERSAGYSEEWQALQYSEYIERLSKGFSWNTASEKEKEKLTICFLPSPW